jgi:hypothetical protein
MHMISNIGTTAIMIKKEEEKEEEFDPDAYIRDNTGLVRLLIALNRSKEGISTRKVCTQVFNSKGYGWQMLEKAAAQKLIERTHPESQTGRGRGRVVINKIAPEGRRLLKKLGLT